MRTKLRGKITLLFITCAVVLAIPAIALADDITNDITATAEVMALQVGATSGNTTTLSVIPQNGDGKNGCNLTGSTLATFSVNSSNPSVATVSPSSVTFSACGDTKTLTVSALSQGSTNITLSQTANTTAGSFNPAPAAFTVNVTDPPPANTPPQVSVTEVSNGETYEKGSVPAAGCSVTDAEDTGESATPSFDRTGLDAYGLGTEKATCSYTDGGGLTETSSATYNIVDTTSPVVADHDPVTAEATGPNGATVNYTNPTAQDAVYDSVAVDCDPPSGSVFPLGETTVNCSATDGSGNTGTNSFTVTVEDTTAPVIASHDDVTAEATGPDGANVDYTSPETTDAVDGNGTANCEPASGTKFALGPTTITCSATDEAGNEAEQTTFTVRVQDTTAPDLTVPGPITREATGPNGAAVDFSADVSATDLVDSNVDVTCDPASGSTFELGTTTVTCTATDDYNNSSSRSFTVTVEDTTGPVISGMPSDITKEATSPNGAPASWPAPTASDVVDGNVTVNCSPNSGSTFALGTTEVTCTATDAAGNSSSAKFNVKVAYGWSNFLQPINVPPVTQSIFKMGSTVPVKFQLTGASSGITNGTFYLKYAYTGTGDNNGEMESVATTTGTTGTQFRYSEGQYIFNWSTKGVVTKPGNYELRVYTDSGGTNLLGKVSIELKK